MAQHDEIVDEILRHSDILEVISEYVELRKRGKNFIGLCPFHKEKTPSFNVSPELGIYKCFGCGKSGNVFSFLMEHNSMSFPEALREMSKRTGIELRSEKKTPAKQAALSKKEQILNALSSAAGLYIYFLHTNSGLEARKYFNKRKFSPELLNKFNLGFSPDSWDQAKTELIKQGFGEDVLEAAGLIISREDASGTYDRFRGRIMFPIKDNLGRIIGFGARIMKDDKSQPKYINSPQTVVYDKSRVLFGLFEAKREITSKKFAILVEGYADVLTLHQAGIETAVASSGTALTKEQLEILAKYTKKLYFVYDADDAGAKATERGLELALEQGFDVNIVRLPQGEDPDSMVREHGKEMFLHHLNDAISFVDFKLNNYKNSGALSTPAGLAEASREIIKLIAMIPDTFQHDFYLQKLASALKLTESQVRRLYAEKNKYFRKNLEKKIEDTEDDTTTESNIKLKEAGSGQENGMEPVNINFNELLPEEKEIFRVLMSDKDSFKLIEAINNFSAEAFFSASAKHIVSYLLDYKRGRSTLNEILNDGEVPMEIKDILSSSVFKEEISSGWEKLGVQIKVGDSGRIISDSLVKLEIRKLNIEINSLKEKIKTAGDGELTGIVQKITLLENNKREKTNLLGNS